MNGQLKRPELAILKEDSKKVRYNEAHELGELINYIIAVLNITKPNTKEAIAEMDQQMLLVGDLIRTEFGHLTIPEIKQAFKMYVSKQFPNIRVFRLLDCIAIGEILTAYTEFSNESLRVYTDQKKQLLVEAEKIKLTVEEKNEIIKEGVLECFMTFLENSTVSDDRFNVFDVLYEMEILPPMDQSEAVLAAYAKKKSEAILQLSKEVAILTRQHTNKFEKEQCVKLYESIKAGSDPLVDRRIKSLVLAGFFSKLKKTAKSYQRLERIIKRNIHKIKHSPYE